MKRYIWNILISLDQLANTILLAGNPDTTISSHCWYHRDKWYGALAVRFIDLLFLPFERDHCQNSYEADEEN